MFYLSSEISSWSSCFILANFPTPGTRYPSRSRPQRPQFFRSAPRIETSGHCQFLSMRQSDLSDLNNESVNRELPVLGTPRGLVSSVLIKSIVASGNENVPVIECVCFFSILGALVMVTHIHFLFSHYWALFFRKGGGGRAKTGLLGLLGMLRWPLRTPAPELSIL